MLGGACEIKIKNATSLSITFLDQAIEPNQTITKSNVECSKVKEIITAPSSRFTEVTKIAEGKGALIVVKDADKSLKSNLKGICGACTMKSGAKGWPIPIGVFFHVCTTAGC